jgi:hypothetical protein
MPLTPTKPVLDAIRARLEAMTWTPAGGPSEPLFGQVRLYASTDMTAAFKDLLLSKQRVALVVVSSADYEPTGNSGLSGHTRTRRVSVVVSDRVIGKGDEALHGSPTTPGALGLLDLVPPAIVGRYTVATPQGNRPVEIRPLSDEFGRAESMESQQPGRFLAVLELEMTGGRLELTDTYVPAI